MTTSENRPPRRSGGAQPAHGAPDDTAPPLRPELVKGTLFWGVALPFLNKAISIATSLVLVRLLAPEIFGQYGLVSAILLFSFTISMDRFMARSFFEEDARARYAAHLSFGALLHIAIFSVLNLTLWLAPLPAPYQEIAPYAHLASLALLLNVPRIFYSSHLQRLLAWRELRSLHLISAVLTSSAAIGLALHGAGVYALVAQNLITPAPYIIALLLRRPDLLRITRSLSGYRETLRFGTLRSVAAMAQSARPLAEATAFTAAKGFAEFGVYGRAIGLGRLTAAWLADQIAVTALPMLARLEPGSDAARRAAGLVVRLALWTSAPLAVAMALFAETATTLLYGPAWAAVIPLVAPALALAVAATLLRGLSLVLLTTAGAGASLALDAALLAAALLALWIALPLGPLIYAWALVAADGAILICALGVLLWRGALGLRDLAATAIPPAALGALGALGAQSETIAALDAAQSPLAMLGAAALCVLIALALARLFDRAGLSEACRLAPGGDRIARLLRLS
ncbi:MAG: oligosaccharide flippase family protein [Pseudomonadota bacterium]